MFVPTGRDDTVAGRPAPIDKSPLKVVLVAVTVVVATSPGKLDDTDEVMVEDALVWSDKLGLLIVEVPSTGDLDEFAVVGSLV